MQITWHGLNCIRLQGKDVTIILDPYSEKEGPKLPRWQSDIVTASSESLAPEKVGGSPFIIDTPGEYEIKGAFIYGIPWKSEKTGEKSILFRVNMEDVAIAHLGSLDRVIPNIALETIEGADIVMLPVGDKNLIDAKTAVEVISRIEPRIVIPMSFSAKGFKKKLDSPDSFYKQLGLKPEKTDKLKIARKDLPEEERLLYELSLA